MDLSGVLAELQIAERNPENLQRILPSTQVLRQHNWFEIHQIISTITDSWLQCLSSETLENKLLEDVLIVIKSRILEVYNDVTDIIENNSFTQTNQQLVKEKLTENVNLLSAVEKIITFYSTFSQISAKHVPNTLSSVNTVMYACSCHLKNCDKFYSSASESIMEVLTALFQKHKKVLLLFSVFVTEKVCFDCEDENELHLLLETLNSVAQVAEAVMSNIDMKMMSTQWKFLYKLIQMHIEYIRSRFDVSGSLISLINQVKLGVNSIINKNITEAPEVTRSLRTCNFFLKIISSICELFQNENKSCYQDLVAFLCYILGYSSPYLTSINMSIFIVQAVETLLTSFSEPFLNLMVLDSQFIQEFFELSSALHTMEPTSKIGFYLLTVTILRKLLFHSDKSDVENNWIRPEVNIIDVAFELMKNDNVQLVLNLSLPGELYCDTPSSEIHPYRCLMISLSAFIVRMVSGDVFPRVEQTLLKNVCQPEVWTAIFASDVWCAVSRYSSAELCLQQVLFLISRILSWPPDKIFQPEWIYFTCLASRLFHFLSEPHKEQIFKKYPLSEENFRIWSALKIPIPEAQQKSAEVLIRGTLIGFLFSEKESKLPQLINALLVATAIDFDVSTSQGEHFLKLSQQLWNCFSNVDLFLSFEESSCAEKRWLHQFLIALSRLTVDIIRRFDNDQTLNVLSKLKDLCTKGNSVPKICTLLVLTAVSNKDFEGNSNKKQILETLINLFQFLLCDSDNTVRQVAFETFSYFTATSRYTEVIPSTARKNQDLKDRITNYLSSSPEPLLSDLSEADYLKQLGPVKFVHKCSLPVDLTLLSANSAPKSVKESSEGVPPKKLKLDCDAKVDLHIKAIETNISALIPLILEDNNQVSNDQKRRLSSVLKSVQNVLKVRNDSFQSF